MGNGSGGYSTPAHSPGFDLEYFLILTASGHSSNPWNQEDSIVDKVDVILMVCC